ncbi:MAG TPA: Uma2 family endonuclease [Candidatus Baltobacteraceae bacterium]|nr:Uma2 family endonuclease [Candidatus Baltobacteraceae bacterium]
MEAMLIPLHDPPEAEYLDGRTYFKVTPRRTHSLVQRALLRELERCAAPHGEFGPEWRYNVGAIDGTETEFVPDIAFISHARLANLTADEAEEPPLAPDVAIEIRSPSTRPLYLQRKIERYLRTGSVLVLDVDPANKRVIAHSKTDVREYSAGERFEHPAIEWFAFDVAAIFPRPHARSI